MNSSLKNAGKSRGGKKGYSPGNTKNSSYNVQHLFYIYSKRYKGEEIILAFRLGSAICTLVIYKKKKKKVKHSEDQIINTALFKLYIKLVYRHSRTCLHLPDINYLFYSLPVQ